MKLTKIVLNFFFALMVLTACAPNETTPKGQITYQCPMDCEDGKVYDSPGSCPVCKMDIMPIDIAEPTIESSVGISEMSIFNLKSKWLTEEAVEIQLEDLKGKTLVMVMIYTTCKAACPRLVADMRNIEAQIPENQKNNVEYVLVSISPETDTPTVLKAFAIENQMDDEVWTFLQGSPANVRELANVLAVKYKEISPIDFSHSNIISVFNPGGELIHQQEGLGVDNQETVSVIIETSKSI